MLKLKLADYSSPQLSVFLVDGQYIRDNIYIDWTEGGNWLRYVDFIPENEIWLGGIHIIECREVLIHEAAEVLYTLENNLDISTEAQSEDDYSEAHDHANTVEMAARNAPNTIDDTLTELLAKLNARLSTEEKMIWKQ